MKKSVLIQILCGVNFFLYGCATQYNGLCTDCSSKERDEMIQKLIVLYPIGSEVSKSGSVFTIKEHTSKAVSSFDNMYGVLLENSGNTQKFENYDSLVGSYEIVLSENQMMQKAKETEEELAINRDTIDSLDFYSKHFSIDEDGLLSMSGCYYTYECKQEMYIVIQTLKDLSVDKRCLTTSYSEKDSDECILARRNAPKTKIGWFNFQKYLPKDSVIKTEQQFIDLYTMYLAVEHLPDSDSWEYDDLIPEWAVRKCYLTKEQTEQEKENCLYEKQEFLENMALGKAPKCSVKYSAKYNKFKQDLTHWHYYATAKEIGDKQRHTKFGAVNLCVPDKIGL